MSFQTPSVCGLYARGRIGVMPQFDTCCAPLPKPPDIHRDGLSEGDPPLDPSRGGDGLFLALSIAGLIWLNLPVLYNSVCLHTCFWTIPAFFDDKRYSEDLPLLRRGDDSTSQLSVCGKHDPCLYG